MTKQILGVSCVGAVCFATTMIMLYKGDFTDGRFVNNSKMVAVLTAIVTFIQPIMWCFNHDNDLKNATCINLETVTQHFALLSVIKTIFNDWDIKSIYSGIGLFIYAFVLIYLNAPMFSVINWYEFMINLLLIAGYLTDFIPEHFPTARLWIPIVFFHYNIYKIVKNKKLSLIELLFVISAQVVGTFFAICLLHNDRTNINVFSNPMVILKIMKIVKKE